MGPSSRTLRLAAVATSLRVPVSVCESGGESGDRTEEQMTGEMRSGAPTIRCDAEMG